MNFLHPLLKGISKEFGRNWNQIGFSDLNLKYMRKFAEVYPDSQIMQAALAQIPWRHNLLIIEKLKDPEARK